MLRRQRRVLLALLLCGVAAQADPPGVTAGGDDKKDQVYRGVAAAKLESLLKQMNIEYDKTDGKAPGVHYYDFERSKFKVRLHNYNGRDLWLDVVFTDPIALKEINGWNVRAKFSRAVQLKGGTRPATALEAQLDCEGGVTDGMIRQFILRFDGEIKNFVQYLTK